MIIIVWNLLVRWNANMNTSTQLINLGDNARGGSRCGDTDAAGRFLETNISCVIAGEMWHSRSVGLAPVNVREVCFDSCNSSSLIPYQVLGVMVCIRCFIISDLQGWQQSLTHSSYNSLYLLKGKIVFLKHASHIPK